VLLFLTRKPGKCPNLNVSKNDTSISESCGEPTMSKTNIMYAITIRLFLGYNIV
jgi:hypothetical protein